MAAAGATTEKEARAAPEVLAPVGDKEDLTQAMTNHEQAGCCSRVLLHWVTPIVRSSWRGALTPEMTPAVLQHLRSERLVDRVAPGCLLKGSWGSPWHPAEDPRDRLQIEKVR
jgi:hypothetical protein